MLSAEKEVEMDYFVFVLGYDLLHDLLDGIECDTAYEFCQSVYTKFVGSSYDNIWRSEYDCLSKYVRDNIDEIAIELAELR